jgi:hypothetical protein
LDRCALFVDANYALAEGALAVHGTRNRDSVSWDYAGLLKLLGGLSRDRTGLQLLRCYWYDTASDGARAAEHDRLADIPGLKLRLSKARPSRKEGVEAEIRKDLTALARNHAVSDVIVVSAEEDLAPVIAEVQDLGIRTTLLHIATDGNWATSRTLRQECDDIIDIGSGHLRPYVDLISGAEPQLSSAGYREIAAQTSGPHAAIEAPSIRLYPSPVAAEYDPAMQFASAGRGDAPAQDQPSLAQAQPGPSSGGQSSQAVSAQEESAQAQSAQGQSGAAQSVQAQFPQAQPAHAASSRAPSLQPPYAQAQPSHGLPPVADESLAQPLPTAQQSAQQFQQLDAGRGQLAAAAETSFGHGGGFGTQDQRTVPEQLNSQRSPGFDQRGGSADLSVGQGVAGRPAQSAHGGLGHSDLGPSQLGQGSQPEALSNGIGSGQHAGGEPGSGYPANGQPVSVQPVSVQPGSGQPGSGQPGTGYPASGQPGTGYPASGQPGTGYPASGQQGSGQQGSGLQGSGQQGTGYPANGQPGGGQPGTGYPANGQSANGQPGGGQLGGGQPGASQYGGYGPQGSSSQQGAGADKSYSGSQAGADQQGFRQYGGVTPGNGLPLTGTPANGLPANGVSGRHGGVPQSGQGTGPQPSAGMQSNGTHGGLPSNGAQSGMTRGGQQGNSQQGTGLQGLGPISGSQQPFGGVGYGSNQAANGHGPGSGGPHSGGAPHGGQHAAPRMDLPPQSNSQPQASQPLPGQPLPGQGQHQNGMPGLGQPAYGQPGQPVPGTQQRGGAGLPPVQSASVPPTSFPPNGTMPPEVQRPPSQRQLPAGSSAPYPQDRSMPYGGPVQPGQFGGPVAASSYGPGSYGGHQPAPPVTMSVGDAVQSAHAEGFGFGEAVARDAPALWLEAVLARKPRMPSDLEARLLQGSALPIDSLLHDEVRHALRRGFWDALERSRH